MRPPHDEWVQGNDSGTYSSPVDKFLIHTTEGTSIAGAISAYRANNSWPHATIDCRIGRTYRICGHLDLDVPARSLRNQAGGVQTNRDGVLQVEVVGSASRPSEIDWAWFGKNVLGPWCRLKGVPLTSTVPWVPYPASYGEKAAQRLTAPGWTAYRGVLGHQHCPENSHGDPGAIPIVTTLAAAGSALPEEDDMPTADEVAEAVWARRINDVDGEGSGPAASHLAWANHNAGEIVDTLGKVWNELGILKGRLADLEAQLAAHDTET